MGFVSSPRCQCLARFRTVADLKECAPAGKLRGEGKLALDEGFINGSFASTPKRGLAVGKSKRGKGMKIMAIAAGNGVPVAATIDSASPHKSKLVGKALSRGFLDELVARLIGDKAYDSDPLDRYREEAYGIEMIAPSHENRNQTQDGRPPRRCKKRWVVERPFAWLQGFRRLVTCYEFHAQNLLGMVRLGCMKIMLRFV